LNESRNRESCRAMSCPYTLLYQILLRPLKLNHKLG
uniref:Ovule protein n=1 Tax=Brugia timori TaxID=42155 RepID=A0A0R3R4J0_9BILA